VPARSEAGERGPGLLRARDQVTPVHREELPGIGEAQPAADLLEQRLRRLALQLGELLRDRGGRVVEGVCHRGEGAKPFELHQQTDASKVKHR
jgi:hypothetical protein